MSEIVAGVGVRYGSLFPLDSSGLMYQPTPDPTEPFLGYETMYIKTFSPTIPEPQNIVHMGNDKPFAQDRLPPTAFETTTFSTGGDNMALDAMIQQVKIRSLNTGRVLMTPGGSHSNQGAEVQCAGLFYRQAIDVDPNSLTFGLRRWNFKLYPKISFTVPSSAFEAGAVDNSYPGTPYPSTLLPWGEPVYSAVPADSLGVKYLTHVKGTSILEPRINVWEADGVASVFTLSNTVANINDVIVWVGGILQIPTTDYTLAGGGTGINLTAGGIPVIGTLVVAMPTFAVA